MDIEHDLLCQYCQLAFDTEEEFSLHSCIEIKLEKPDSKVDGLEYNCDSFDLDVSEDFINKILKHVDDLCDIIRNGDPSLERTTEVNENLNSAVSCYRSMLILTKQNFIQKKNQEFVSHNTREIIQPCQFYYEYIDPKHVEDNWDEMECSRNDSDTDYKPKIENTAKKKSVSKVTKPKFSRPEKPKTDFKEIDEPIKAETKSDIEINPKFTL